jgi:hypothetical protein
MALCSRGYGFAADFWNKKGSADWSPDEVHQLLNKSPWAKEVTATMAARSGSGGGGGNNGGNSGLGGGNRGLNGGGMGGGGRGMGGMGNGGGAGGMGGGGGTPRMPQQVKGLVRWESAKPIREASKETLPDSFANHYVISLIGFPIGGRRSDSDDNGAPKLGKTAADRIKSATKLTPKGRDAVEPDVVQLVGTALLLGFAQDSLKLSPDDREVAFATALGRMSIKTKFTFKEMMYHENLAI